MTAQLRQRRHALDSSEQVAEPYLRHFRALLPSWVVVTGMSWGGDFTCELPVEEASLTGSFAPKRFREFAAGRLCARRALVLMGHDALAIPVGANRAPVWPRDVVGSITHTGNRCAVAVASSHRCNVLGIDIERIDRVICDFDRSILTRREQSAGRATPDFYRAIVFSAKECVYKCYNPLTQRYLDFADVEVTIDWATSDFYATIVSSAAAPPWAGRVLAGRFATDADHVYTALVL
jgi:4'-phosphopantetheinyl transferase EntD